jgi:hypothetical protein
MERDSTVIAITFSSVTRIENTVGQVSSQLQQVLSGQDESREVDLAHWLGLVGEIRLSRANIVEKLEAIGQGSYLNESGRFLSAGNQEPKGELLDESRLSYVSKAN